MKLEAFSVRELKKEECSNAKNIQAAIDNLPPDGGVIQLPELDLTLDRGLELRSGVELRGCGAKMILRKAPGESYPLSGYCNYGMLDVELLGVDGLAVFSFAFERIPRYA